MKGRTLVIDDEDGVRFYLQEALTRQGLEVKGARTAKEGLEAIAAEPFDVILMDVRLPDLDGIEAVRRARELDPSLVIIVITAFGTKEIALEAISAGAYDFFVKPLNADELGIVVRRALEKRRLEEQVRTLRQQIQAQQQFPEIAGTSRAMGEVFAQMRKVLGSDANVLIRGETGTGKELVARALHQHSPRREKPFIRLNCVAIPETLLESELFGHEKGAFTGAVSVKPGKFELAHEGTILLDEIGDMSLATQSKILRLIQEREFERVGGTKTLKVDVRIIASTHQDLRRAIQENRFREDLFFRLHVISLYLPPLRERPEDIPLLAQRFLQNALARSRKAIFGFSSEAMDLLMRYPWPGNVRELENALESAAVMCEEDQIRPEHLPEPLQAQADTGVEAAASSSSLHHALAQTERTLLLDAIERAEGVQARAAQILGVKERTLWYLVKKHRLDVKEIKRRLRAASEEG